MRDNSQSLRVVALISGGKDSTYNMVQCTKDNHQIIALANLYPESTDELDSYMYQSVGHEIIKLYAEAIDIPLYRAIIKGNAKTTEKYYSEPVTGDEVEDLYQLLCEVKKHHEFDAVSVGAIFSEYQYNRVANVCHRLNIKVLTYLWKRDQKVLLDEMIDNGIEAIIIKTAAMGKLNIEALHTCNKF
ncbi:unnamed protein product [Didymodactylos carnosus]|uniref:Diphthine--ammonia ligase n=1 Tax=Didymodactylos carnosus TaxID=1234261 RepID=A0A814KE26_9BILA|nr:unnamed protein product [Didymodactylos carnosus]CAF1476548.1 unnamed protein product [Didymodactylos carnosus]CAF3819415.1 unnamed protein product [Didymodactylos carnosus]CAF4267605.1 unnamed protein product [Didymodactylos carnosus]